MLSDAERDAEHHQAAQPMDLTPRKRTLTVSDAELTIVNEAELSE